MFEFRGARKSPYRTITIIGAARASQSVDLKQACKFGAPLKSIGVRVDTGLRISFHTPFSIERMMKHKLSPAEILVFIALRSISIEPGKDAQEDVVPLKHELVMAMIDTVGI